MARSTSALALAGVPRVNLLPRVEIERRARNALAVSWLWALLGAAVIVALVAAGAFWLQWSASQRLEAEQARTTKLVSDLGGLSDVAAQVNAEAQLKSFLATSMGYDIEWGRTVSSLAGALPGGVSLTGFDLTAGGTPKAAPAKADAVKTDAAADAASSAVGLTGTLTFGGPSPVEIAPVIRSIRAIPGVLDADGTQVTRTDGTDGGYTYQLTITFDQSVYSGAFAKAAN